MSRLCPRSPLPTPRCLSCCCASLSPICFFHDRATPDTYTLSLHDALPIPPTVSPLPSSSAIPRRISPPRCTVPTRSEEHTSELQSLTNLVCRLRLEKKKGTGMWPEGSGRGGCRR